MLAAVSNPCPWLTDVRHDLADGRVGSMARKSRTNWWLSMVVAADRSITISVRLYSSEPAIGDPYFLGEVSLRVRRVSVYEGRDPAFTSPEREAHDDPSDRHHPAMGRTRPRRYPAAWLSSGSAPRPAGNLGEGPPPLRRRRSLLGWPTRVADRDVCGVLPRRGAASAD